ncbi:MAG: NAD(+) diphosphatase [Anaerolineae bacterium]|nr:NAD(+) diphosphatase [Anaerolineae bacterium]
MNENFVPATIPPDNRAVPSLWFLFHKFDLLVFLDEQGQAALPRVVSPAALDLGDFRVVGQQYFGYLQNKTRLHCYAGELVPEQGDPNLPDGLALMHLRRLYGRFDEAMLWLAGRAVQLVDWDRTHQFCGRCGTPTHTAPNERVKQCPHCGHTSYPRLSPAVIVQVTREGKNGREILLARNKRNQLPMYSVLAGFVEPGETLETCVRREIREEVNLEVKNIRYFGSQPWPFPNSLMVAFTAEYASGDIVLEEAELVDAQWFRADNLPLYPPPMSIAHRLIEDFRQAESMAVNANS